MSHDRKYTSVCPHCGQLLEQFQECECVGLRTSKPVTRHSHGPCYACKYPGAENRMCDGRWICAACAAMLESLWRNHDYWTSVIAAEQLQFRADVAKKRAIMHGNDEFGQFGQ